MKTLLLLRHAKSSWDNDGLPDFDRPLNKRGQKAAPRVGEYLRQHQLIPDLVLASQAKRAWDTIQMVAEVGGFKDRVRAEPELYAADPAACLVILRRLPATLQRVMLVGHNPTLDELLALLTNEERHLSTATLAQIALPLTEWSNLTGATRGQLLGLWRPSRL